MKKLYRRFFLLLFVLIFAVSGTGCEQILAEIPFLQSAQPTTLPAVTPDPVITPLPQATLTAETPAVDPYQITLWLPPEFDPENGTLAGSLLKQQLDQFTSEYPDYTLTVRIKAPGGEGGMLDSLNTASLAAPAVVPGILIMPRLEFEKAARAGLLMSIDLSEFEGEQAAYFPYANAMTLVRGTRYGVPFAGDALCMAYKPNEVAYPHTKWRELVQVNVKVTAFPASDPQGLMQTLLYMSLGGDFGGDETRVNLDEPALQQSLLLLSEGASANAFPTWLSDYTTFEQSWQALLNSNATYAVIWASRFLANHPEKITLGNLPKWDELGFTLADGWVLTFPQTSAEQLAEYQLLAEYLLENEFLGSWTEAIGLMPVTESALSQWENAGIAGVLQQISLSARPLPGNFVMSAIGPVFSQATIEMIRKQTTYIESSNKIMKALAE